MTSKCIADIVGHWVEVDFDSGLIEHCKRYWNVPVSELPDLMVATYLDQSIAMSVMVEEARRRLATATPDDSELFDGQLEEAFERATRKD